VSESTARDTTVVRVIERWRSQRFDMVLCYPSGYCCPSNSAALTRALPAGYHSYPIDSDDAYDAVAASMQRGALYGT
jgi:hypothetical protein